LVDTSFDIIFPSMLKSSQWSISLRFQGQICSTLFSSLPCVLHAYPISPYLIFSTTNIPAECTNYEVPCLVIFSNFLLLTNRGYQCHASKLASQYVLFKETYGYPSNRTAHAIYRGMTLMPMLHFVVS
jgi:hypothetical protein